MGDAKLGGTKKASRNYFHPIIELRFCQAIHVRYTGYRKWPTPKSFKQNWKMGETNKYLNGLEYVCLRFLGDNTH